MSPTPSRRRVLVGLVSFGAALGVVAGCGSPPPPMAPPEAPAVGVQHPAIRDYAPTKEFNGRLQTKDPVTVVPQVSGMLLRRAFEEGQIVEKDKTVLFEIDKALFDADLRKATADVAKADADIKNWTAQIKFTTAEEKRLTDLKGGGISESELDKARANVDVAKAQVDVAKAAKDAAEAAVARAKENLRYCTIVAPANGRTGRAKVPERGIVDAYRTVLVEIHPTDPIYALWDIDELTSLWYRDQIRANLVGDPKKRTLMCAIKQKNAKQFSAPQPITYYDPELARGTGTRTIRAEFPNPTGDLSSGDSVRVRVDAGLPRKVMTVPETAVFAQQRKRYVYVAVATPEGDKAELREVEPGAAFDGVVIIDGGVTAGDRVIVDNLLRVRPGVKVQVKQ